MRGIYVVLVVFIALSACKPEAPEGYVVNGTIKGAGEGTKVKMKLSDASFFLGEEGREVIDSTTIKDGKFQFTGKIDFPALYTITIAEPDKDRLDQPIIQLFLENTRVDISAELNEIATLNSLFSGTYTLENVDVKSSAGHESYAKYLEGIKPLMERTEELWAENTKNWKEKKKLSISEGIDLATRFEKNSEEKQKFLFNYLKNNMNTPVGQYVANYVTAFQITQFSKKQWDEIIPLIPENTKAFPGIDVLLKNANAAKRISEGADYVDLSFKDTAGNPVKLSDLAGKGKYVLVEFWASWCGPCRLDIPHLKEVYELYNPDGYEIISVSLDDDHDAWLKAVDEEQMPWLQVSDSKGFKGDIANIYQILGIPACFLIDPNGKIVTNNMRGSHMDKRLIAMYGNKFGDKF